MKASTLFTMFFTVLSIICCSKNDNPTNYDVRTDLLFKRSDGTFLKKEDITWVKVTYQVGDRLVEPRLNLGHPNGYTIEEDENGNALVLVFPYSELGINESKNIVKINDNKPDTLTTLFDAPNKNSIYCAEVLVNDTLRWDTREARRIVTVELRRE